MKKFTRLSMFLAMAVVLNLVETFIPFFSGYIPGLKLGLANTIILFVLFTYGFKDAVYISILRVILVGVLRTGIFSVAFFLSLSGAICSILVMGLLKKVKIFSVIGVSIVGSIFHSLGQVLVASLLLKNDAVLYYLPLLLLFSIPTGIFVGFVSKEIVNRFKNILIS